MRSTQTDDVKDSSSSLASHHAAPLGVSLKRALSMLYATGRFSLLALIVMTLIRGLLPAVQVSSISELVSAVAHEATRTESGSGSHFYPNGLWALALFAGALIGAYVLENVIKYVSDQLTLRLSYDTDVDLVHKLRTFEVQDFESATTYDAIQRVDSSTGSHIFGLFDSARSAIQGVIAILGVVTVIASWNIWIALMLLVAPIPAAIATFQMQTKAYDIEYARAPKLRLAAYFRALLTSDAARKEIKIFSLEKLFEQGYIKLRKIFLQQDRALTVWNLKASGGLGLISVFANVGAVIVATFIALQGNGVGELAGFISATSQMNGLVLSAFLGVTGIYQHLLYVSNWVAVMEMNPSNITEGTCTMYDSETTEKSDAEDSIKNRNAISVEFRNVSFTYPGTDRQVLDNVSFTIEKGTTTALVGLNGSGKTTVCKLILRFYEPTKGEILLNTIPIQKLSRKEIYEHCSALFQDFVKFERSLGDNITFGRGHVFDDADTSDASNSLEDVRASLKAVGLFSLEQQLPQGFHTLLGRRFEGGRQLSIGQWQRLATARALYKNPSLLVLDEPTASVDAVSEQAMFEAIADIDRPMTVLLVAHRFTTISHAQHIIVLDQGRVVGDGDHHTLLDSCKFYADMYAAQQGYY